MIIGVKKVNTHDKRLTKALGDSMKGSVMQACKPQSAVLQIFRLRSSDAVAR